MSILLQNVGLPLFLSVETGALKNLHRTLSNNRVLFRRGGIICGDGPTKEIAQRAAKALKKQGMKVKLHSVAGAQFEEVDRLKNELIENFFPDVLLGVGGGSVTDVTKMAASEKRLPWVSVPTSASNDGFCSPVAVLRSEGKKKSVGASMPVGVVVDLQVLQDSPRRLRVAGVGDLLSNLTAVEDWVSAAKKGKASVNEFARMLSLAGPRQLMTFTEPDIDRPEFVQRAIEGLILGGIAMEISGSSRPCSGSEHLISHAIDRLGVGHGLHGEQVAIASVFCRAMQEKDPQPLQDFLVKLGAPSKPEDLGLDRESFFQAVKLGVKMRPGRWTVLSRRKLQGEFAEEQYNRCFG